MSDTALPAAWSLDRVVRSRFDRLLARAGVQIDGSEPCDPQIRSRRFYARALLLGTLGLGEGYVEGDWECEALDELTARLARLRLDYSLEVPLADIPRIAFSLLTNRQSRQRASNNSRSHYQDRNDLYGAMLGPAMTYSCGYWRSASDLEQAQRAKLELICQKLRLRPGQRVLDIGCGWGSFAYHAAVNHEVEVVGITVVPSQASYAQELCRGLPVEIRLQDYRELDETFDHIVSIGMFEHVGSHNYRGFLRLVRDCLSPDGLFLLHTIGTLRSMDAIDPWVDRYIFPGAVLPSAAQLTAAIEGLFVLEDWHNFGADYDRTLMAWHRNFERAWPSLAERYGERFRRIWRYYLLTCAGMFRARATQLWQLVLSRDGVMGGYRRCAE